MNENNSGYVHIIFLPRSNSTNSVVSDYEEYYKKFTRYIEQHATEIKFEQEENSNSENNLSKLHFTINMDIMT